MPMHKKHGKQMGSMKSMKPKGNMPKGGSLTPRGDIGLLRQKEAIKLGTFKGVKSHACADAL